MSSPVGKIIDRSYRLYEQLGVGGMGAVYRAAQLLTGRQVALKLVAQGHQVGRQGDVTRDQELRLALAREFQTLASLHHPNIIRVLSYGFDEDLGPYFTMDLLHQPQTLLGAAAEQPLEAKVLLIAQLLRALVYVHQRGILHCDIKPSNVLVVQGEVKLLDFGIASRIKSDANLAGTLYYMAPELLLRQPASVRSELYAVGILLYQCLAGTFPYSHDSVTRLLQGLFGEDSDHTFSPTVANLLDGYRTPAMSPRLEGSLEDAAAASELPRGEPALPLPGDIPSALSDTVHRLIARRPEDRPDNASAALNELATALNIQVLIETAATRESFLQATELVGRESELQQLSSAMEQARARQGMAFLIGGESGIGKSRLLAELRTQALVSGLWVVEGQSVTEGGLYYQEVLPLLRALCVQTELADPQASIFKLFVPDIDVLLGRAISAPTLTTPEEIRIRLFQTLSELLSQLRKPLLLLLEDLHWARRETLVFMAHLLEALPGLPIMLIGTFRSDESPDLPARFPTAQYMPLRRLDSEQISRLSALMLGSAGKDPKLVSYLEQQTEGNVFFLVEIMRALAEGAGELQSISRGELPEDVLTAGIERIIDRRIDQVQAAHRPALELAATYGRKLDLAMMEQAFPALSIPHFLVECANVTVLESQGSDWRFAHDKLRQSILRRVAEPAKRQRLHLQIAETLERLTQAEERQPHPTAPGYSDAILGYHFRQAGVLDKALYKYQQAGDQAANILLYDEALLHYQSATDVLQGLPSTPTLSRLQVDLLTKQLQCSNLALSIDVYVQRVAQAQQILESLHGSGIGEHEDRLRRARLEFESGNLFILMNQCPQATACFGRVTPIAREFQDQKLLILTQSMQGRGLLLTGMVTQTIAILEPLVADIEQLWGRGVETMKAYSYLAGVLAANGRGRDMARLLEYIQPWSGQNQQLTYLLPFFLNSCLALLFAGDWTEALRINDCLIAAVKKLKGFTMEYMPWDLRAWILKQRGDYETALSLLLRASELRHQVGGRFFQGYSEANYADILFRLGRSAAAIGMAEQATWTARRDGSMLELPMAERAWGRALARLGADPAEVDAHLRESLRVANEVGQVMEAVQSEIAWAQVCRERQDSAAASAYFRQARDHVTDQMLPCAQASFLQTIDHGLQSCGSPPFTGEPGR